MPHVRTFMHKLVYNHNIIMCRYSLLRRFLSVGISLNQCYENNVHIQTHVYVIIIPRVFTHLVTSYKTFNLIKNCQQTKYYTNDKKLIKYI